MAERIVKISSSCRLVVNTWKEFPPMVELQYTEHSPDYYYSDSEAAVDIDEATAREMIALLSETFGPAAPEREAPDAR